MSHRVEQVSSLIQTYISEMIRRDLEVPLGVVVSVTKVTIGPDLKFAKIFVSIIPEDQQTATLAYLQKQRRVLQQDLAGRLTMKFSPKIGFALDTTLAHVQKIEELLDSVKTDS